MSDCSGCIINNLVLSGGGVKGIVMMGALKALEEYQLLKNIKSISTASVGALIGALYIVGYSIDELHEFLSILDISKMKSIKPSKLLTNFGFDDGKKLIMVIELMLKARNLSPEITLKELYNLREIDLYISGSCLNDKKNYYFSHHTHPTMPLKIAIRISTSVPLWYIPVEYENKMYVDGGCMENYPISIFDNDLDRTIGIHLTSSKTFVKSIDSLESFLFNLMQCFDEGSELKAICGYEKNTIQLCTKFSSLNLNLQPDTKKEMFEFGYKNAKESDIVKKFSVLMGLNE